MKEIAIIGAGQLGSRHLQGVLKSTFEFNITVIDPVAASLSVAEQRASEIPHQHAVKYSSSISDLPSSLDLVIVATNSNVRLKVLLELLGHAKVNTLVLEKVLFQQVVDYEIAYKAIQENGVICYVNHPRRMQSVYKQVKSIIKEYSHELFTIQAYGANWGLGCNGLHISDAIVYLFEDSIAKYKNSQLDHAVIDSKRQGFKEFSGSLQGLTEKGHQFTIISLKTDDLQPTPISITLFSPSLRIYIAEGNQPMVTITRVKPGLQTENLGQEPMLFQSDLSKEVVESALANREIDLPVYEEAMANHLLFIESLNDHIQKITQEKTTVCPIT